MNRPFGASGEVWSNFGLCILALVFKLWGGIEDLCRHYHQSNYCRGAR